MRIENAPAVVGVFPLALPQSFTRRLGGADKVTLAVRYQAADAAATLHVKVSWISPSGAAFADVARSGSALQVADWTFAPGDVAEHDLALEWEVPAGFAAQSFLVAFTETGAGAAGNIGLEVGSRAEDVA